MGAGYECQVIRVVELLWSEVSLKGGESRRNHLCTSRVTFPPNSQPAPRGLTAHVSISSGSDHMRSTVCCMRDTGEQTQKRWDTNRKRHPHVEFPGHATRLVLDLVYVCLVRAHRAHKVSLRQLSIWVGFIRADRFVELVKGAGKVTYSGKV